MQMLLHTKPTILKSDHGWYVKYKHQIPEHLRLFYDERKWLTFRVKHNVNRFKGQDREQYAEWLRSQIELSLKTGYSPFAMDEEYLTSIGLSFEKPKEPEYITARQALWYFLEKWKLRGLDADSFVKYKRYISRLIEWLITKDLHNTDIKNINQDHIETFLEDNRTKHRISNRESNNTFDLIRTAFRFLQKKKFVSDNPCSDISKLKAPVKKHRFFDQVSLDKITQAMELTDPYTYFAFQCVYYLCIRSDEEIQNLKVGNIFWEHNKIFAEFGKGKTQRYIPMDQNIKQILIDRGYDKLPGHLYLFGIKGKPSDQMIGPGFFAKRFRKVRDAIEMDPAYTIYGAKHTRVVHLKTDGVADADIMSLTGHKDYVAFAAYLRDLGLTADVNNINKKSRKI